VDTTEVAQRQPERVIPRDTFRARLMLTRLHAGDLTIREAAAKCGLNYGSWANWEKGIKPRDKLETAEAISDGLGVDRDWLLFGGPLAPEDRRHGRVVSRPGRRLTGSYPIATTPTTPTQPDSHHIRPSVRPAGSPRSMSRVPAPTTASIGRPARLSHPPAPAPHSATSR
jgi:transcriptional regulator with XRE-family HTH domain